MLESKIQSKIISWLNDNGCYVVKVQQASRAGVADIVCCVNGLFVAIETKQPHKDLEPLQKYNANKVRNAGGIAFKADNLQDVITAITNIRRGRP